MKDTVDNGVSAETTEVNAKSVEGPISRLPKAVVQLPVLVYSGGKRGRTHCDECKTIQVDPQGALLAMTRKVAVGQSILLINSESGQEMVCQVQSVIPGESGLKHVDVQFSTASSEFWQTTFPTEGSDNPERESPQNLVPAIDPLVQSLSGQDLDRSSDNVLETKTAENLEPSEVGTDEMEAAEVGSQQIAESLPEAERDSETESDSARPGKATESAGKDASPEITESSEPVAPPPARRGPRLHLETPVLVKLPGETSHVECKTVEVGTFGALIVIPKDVDVGQSLLLTNPNSSKQISCRVRNVKQIEPGVNHVGVEFAVESSIFWGMTFPFGEWASSEAKPPQRPKPAGKPSIRKPPRPITAEVKETAIDKPTAESRTTRKWLAIIAAVFLGLILLGVVIAHKWNTAPGPAVSSIYNDVSPDEARLIPGIENYRLATLGDFNPDAVSWLKGTGQQVTGQVSGAFSAFGQSRVYLLMGKDNIWRIVILANGQLRCDAQYRAVAIVARVPKESIQKINWADPPPSDAEGDGLLVVRAANDFGTSVVLFLRGDQVVSGTPSDYRQIPFDQPSNN